jgi:hypothetical protein
MAQISGTTRDLKTRASMVGFRRPRSSNASRQGGACHCFSSSTAFTALAKLDRKRRAVYHIRHLHTCYSWWKVDCMLPFHGLGTFPSSSTSPSAPEGHRAQGRCCTNNTCCFRPCSLDPWDRNLPAKRKISHGSSSLAAFDRLVCVRNPYSTRNLTYARLLSEVCGDIPWRPLPGKRAMASSNVVT